MATGSRNVQTVNPLEFQMDLDWEENLSSGEVTDSDHGDDNNDNGGDELEMMRSNDEASSKQHFE